MVVKQKAYDQSRKTRQGTRTEPDIQVEIEKLAADGWNAAAIHRKLSTDPRYASRLPVARTIQNLVRSVTPRDTSGPWSLGVSSPDDAQLVLPVLAAVSEQTDGRRETMTLLEADWVVRLRRAIPDLPVLWAARLAWLYMLRADREQTTVELDQMLGFAPWRGENEFIHYRSFAERAHPDWFPTNAEAQGPGISAALAARLTRAYAMRVAAEMSGDQPGADFFRVQRLHQSASEWAGRVPEATLMEVDVKPMEANNE